MFGGLLGKGRRPGASGQNPETLHAVADRAAKRGGKAIALAADLTDLDTTSGKNWIKPAVMQADRHSCQQRRIRPARHIGEAGYWPGSTPCSGFI
jgi:hypothetical protein